MRSPSFVERATSAATAAGDACGAYSPEGHRCTVAGGSHAEHETHVPLRAWRFINKDDAYAVGLPVGLVTTDRLSGPHFVVVARWPAAMRRRGARGRVHLVRRPR